MIPTFLKIIIGIVCICVALLALEVNHLISEIDEMRYTLLSLIDLYKSFKKRFEDNENVTSMLIAALDQVSSNWEDDLDDQGKKNHNDNMVLLKRVGKVENWQNKVDSMTRKGRSQEDADKQ